MSADLGAPLRELRVDGGAARNNLLMQRQADLLGARCVRPTVLETTGLGSALLAGLAVGVWDSMDAVVRAWREERSLSANMDGTRRTEDIARWKEAVSRA